MFLLGGMAMLVAWYLSGKYFIESPRWLAVKGKGDAEKHGMQVESQIELETSLYHPGGTNARRRICRASGQFLAIV
jgi:putative MFS transporter